MQLRGGADNSFDRRFSVRTGGLAVLSIGSAGMGRAMARRDQTRSASEGVAIDIDAARIKSSY